MLIKQDKHINQVLTANKGDVIMDQMTKVEQDWQNLVDSFFLNLGNGLAVEDALRIFGRDLIECVEKESAEPNYLQQYVDEQFDYIWDTLTKHGKKIEQLENRESTKGYVIPNDFSSYFSVTNTMNDSSLAGGGGTINTTHF